MYLGKLVLHFQRSARAVTDLNPLPSLNGLLRFPLIHPSRRGVRLELGWIAATLAFLLLDGRLRILEED